MGDSYRLYLRDTAVLQAKHVTALEQSSFDFISLYGENCTTLPDIFPDDTAWVFINSILPEEKGGEIPISKRGGEIPTIRKQNSNLF
jgi:hypothetical protein